MIREVDELQLRAFNDQGEFDIDAVPGLVLEELSKFNVECMKDKMKVEVVVKDGAPRSIKLEVQEADCVKLQNEGKEIEDGPADELTDSIVVKIKFFKATDDPEGRTRVHFNRKFGDVVHWTNFFEKMREYNLNDVLLLPREHLC